MLIGREEEQKRLLKLIDSEYSEFVAVYGRRRVGKMKEPRWYYSCRLKQCL